MNLKPVSRVLRSFKTRIRTSHQSDHLQSKCPTHQNEFHGHMPSKPCKFFNVFLTKILHSCDSDRRTLFCMIFRIIFESRKRLPPRSETLSKSEKAPSTAASNLSASSASREGHGKSFQPFFRCQIHRQLPLPRSSKHLMQLQSMVLRIIRHFSQSGRSITIATPAAKAKNDVIIRNPLHA